MAEETKLDVDVIESSIAAALAEPLPASIHRIADKHRTREAMAAVNRATDREMLQLEAFVDEAIHLRVSMVRGSYQPGPRDQYVRKLMLDALMSISTSNAHDLSS